MVISETSQGFGEFLPSRHSIALSSCEALKMNERDSKGRFIKGFSAKFYGRKEYKKGKDHYNYKERIKHSEGYWLLHAPNHPNCRKDGLIMEHRLIMEKKLGRYLKPEEIAHHINKDITDNRPENLELIKNQSQHLKNHVKNRNFGRIIDRNHILQLGNSRIRLTIKQMLDNRIEFFIGT